MSLRRTMVCWSGGWANSCPGRGAASFTQRGALTRVPTLFRWRMRPILPRWTRISFMADDNIRPRREDFSPLDKHHRQGKVFTPPLMRIPGITPQSWYNERLPDMLWAALLTEALPRDQYIRHLSLVAKAAMRFRDSPDVYPQHTTTARLSTEQFRGLFGQLLADEQARGALSPLLLLDGLPDRAHWKSSLAVPDQETGWPVLAAAMAQCMDRRGLCAIDLRWL